MSKRNRIQITLTDDALQFLKEDMEKRNIQKYTLYFQKLLDEHRKENVSILDHILKNSRDTNKKVLALLEVINYVLTQEKYGGSFIPIETEKSEILEEAELAVSHKLAVLREIKLNNAQKTSEG